MLGKVRINCLVYIVLLISTLKASNMISNSNYQLDYDIPQEELDQLDHLGDIIFEQDDKEDEDNEADDDLYIIKYDENTKPEDIIKQLIEQEESRLRKKEKELIKNGDESQDTHYEESESLSLRPKDISSINLELINHNETTRLLFAKYLVHNALRNSKVYYNEEIST